MVSCPIIVTNAQSSLRGIMMLGLVLSIGLKVSGTPVPMQLVGGVDAAEDASTAAKGIEVGKDMASFEDPIPSKVEISAVRKNAALTSLASDLQDEDLNEEAIAEALGQLYSSGSSSSDAEVLTHAQNHDSGQAHMEIDEEEIQRISRESREYTEKWGNLQRLIVREKKKVKSGSAEGSSLAVNQMNEQSTSIWHEAQRTKLKAFILRLVKQYNQIFPGEKMTISKPELAESGSRTNQIQQVEGRLSEAERAWLAARQLGRINIEKNSLYKPADLNMLSNEGKSPEDFVKELEVKAKELLANIVKKRAQARILRWAKIYNQRYNSKAKDAIAHQAHTNPEI